MVVHATLFSFKGETQIRMDNLDDYILSFQNYKEGNYEYETITSQNDVREAVENGKKFVFTIAGAKIELIFGLIFISIGLIITLSLYAFVGIEAFTFDLSIFMISLLPIFVFAPLGLRFLIPGLWKLRPNFIVLGAEGIVYKKRGAIKSCKWKDISMDIVEKTSEISKSNFKVIYISMPNGDFLKNVDYTTKEFPKTIRGRQIDTMSFHAFLNYYNYGKLGSFESSIYK